MSEMAIFHFTTAFLSSCRLAHLVGNTRHCQWLQKEKVETSANHLSEWISNFCFKAAHWLHLEPTSGAKAKRCSEFVYDCRRGSRHLCNLLPCLHSELHCLHKFWWLYADWGPMIDVVGFCFLNMSQDYEPSASLVSWLKAGPAPIYVGFGSLVSKYYGYLCIFFMWTMLKGILLVYLYMLLVVLVNWVGEVNLLTCSLSKILKAWHRL